MRGLRSGHGGGGTAGRAAAGLAAVGLSGLLAAGCSTGGAGVRDEGTAPVDQGARSGRPTPDASASAPFRRVDAIALLKGDPKVGDQVKRDLKPCASTAYPVDTVYGNLTGSGVADVVVNVLTCGDAVGVGTYVYRMRGQRYENVFSLEEPAVYAEIDRGDLVVTKQVYGKDDPIAYPSGEDVITYRWSADRFAEQYVVHHEYSEAVEGGGVGGPAPTAPSGN
ncbi:hypothetical protein LUX12_10750 [Streptomyces somaliensis]|uniref:Lipoprotein CseA n=1 Tax=Streptomyces somaliensis (strain ATCC 33201 / DSM 40738 / JCM 12659 / KCTC 9044 / NCTC 11332 / NRRL B-12077 / IP 733) TaxID=1134445 RepID=A0AA44IDI4_STRE0|nr:hypothetical protein [Streptomyces somaliensis]MCP9945147.1 hypothetical protein [Streptomyces somaliensis]MCP9961632.1 hypothetical protein [Streptomyces somaliensis]NKY14661.1 hypothetical protein [Streptomyces somaliensis DSM 40738]